MKILVTGGNGFLGGAVVERLLEGTAFKLRCLVRPGSPHASLGDLLHRYPGRGEIVYGSLADKQCCGGPLLQDVDLVIHLASAKGGAPAEMFQGSSVATRNLLDAVRSASRPVKLLHCSSFSVYGVAALPHGAVVDEETPLEPLPFRRDLYAYSKWHQEKLVREYAQQYGIPTTILRPGVIYGPGGSPLSPRVGLSLFGLFLFMGGSNIVPLTHVVNCADAFVVAAQRGRFTGDVYNVVDDDLVTAREYLRRYRKQVKPVRCLPVPYPLILLLSRGCEWYFRKSRGQLPEIFTRYKSANMWKGNRFDNGKLKSIGWRPGLGTDDGIRRYFETLRKAGE